MSMGDRGWRDSTENYCDSWVSLISGTSATAIEGIDYTQPAVVFGLQFTGSQFLTTGTVTLQDGSATADTNPIKWGFDIASGATTTPDGVSYCAMFPRGLAFDNGIIVSATTVTGYVNVLYKARYK